MVRLGSSTANCSKESLSAHAALHGINRRKLGYTGSMLVEESRILQVSIFHTLHNNLANIEFGLLLIGVATIADEVDSQLRQAMECFNTGSGRQRRPPWDSCARPHFWVAGAGALAYMAVDNCPLRSDRLTTRVYLRPTLARPVIDRDAS